MEDAGTQAVEEYFAFICGIVGNALADEAAELAAKLLRPSPAKCKEAELADTEAFLIAIRIGLTQACHWEQLEDAWVYEMPAVIEQENVATEVELIKVTQKLADNGHVLESEVRGNLFGEAL